MMSYGKPDIAKFISIKCDCKLKQAEEMISAFYEFIEYNLLEGDSVNCYPLGIFSLKNIGARKERLLTNNFVGDVVIPYQEPHSKPIFKFNKTLCKTIKDKTKNNQFDIPTRKPNKYLMSLYNKNTDENSVEIDDNGEDIDYGS